jgi:hypothetical protein
MKPGRELGRMLDYLLSEVLEKPSLNQYETLLALAEKRMKKDRKDS